jgi:hypothetical protein
VEKERLENKDFEDMALDRNVRVLWDAWSGTALCVIACSEYRHGAGGRTFFQVAYSPTYILYEDCFPPIEPFVAKLHL